MTVIITYDLETNIIVCMLSLFVKLFCLIETVARYRDIVKVARMHCHNCCRRLEVYKNVVRNFQKEPKYRRVYNIIWALFESFLATFL